MLGKFHQPQASSITTATLVGGGVTEFFSVWVQEGLVNETVGTTCNIIFNNDGSPALPVVFICTFPAYTGLSFLLHVSDSFPVKQITHIWTSGIQSFSGKGIPLSLHKCQVLTPKPTGKNETDLIII